MRRVMNPFDHSASLTAGGPFGFAQDKPPALQNSGEKCGLRSKRAMNLVELLVVMGIVAILASLLLSALRSVRAEADIVSCLSNLRQLGLAFHMYAGENEDRLPYPNASYGGPNEHPELSWFNALDPYLLGLLAATSKSTENLSFAKQDPIIQRLGAQWLLNAHTLKMNEYLNRDTAGTLWSEYIWSLEDFVRPELTVLMVDGKAEFSKLASGLPGFLAILPEGSEGDVMRRHSDRANVLFVDGHAELRNENHQITGDRLGWKLDQTSLIWKPWAPPP